MDIKKRYRLVSIGLIVMVILNILMLGSLWLMRPPLRGHANTENRRGIQRIFKRELNLTHQQQKKFKSLNKRYRIKIRAVSEQIRQNREKLYKIMGTADSVQADSFTGIIAEGHRKIERVNVRHFRALRAQLNHDQQQKFDKMIRRVITFSSHRPQ